MNRVGSAFQGHLGTTHSGSAGIGGNGQESGSSSTNFVLCVDRLNLEKSGKQTEYRYDLVCCV